MKALIRLRRCADADLDLCCPHMPEDMFSHGGAHMLFLSTAFEHYKNGQSEEYVIIYTTKKCKSCRFEFYIKLIYIKFFFH